SGFSTCRYLNERGVNCQMIHPADVPTTGKEKLQKTDKVDSRKLARLLRSNEIEFIYIPDQQFVCDRSLVRLRSTCIKDLTRIKNRVKGSLLFHDIKIPERFTESQSRSWSKAYMNWLLELDTANQSLNSSIKYQVKEGMGLKGIILELTRELRVLARHTRYKQDIDLCLTVPGIGLVTALNIVFEIGDMNRFKTLDQLCNYISLVPSMYGSGDKIRTGRIVKRGKKKLKTMMIEASWQAVRKDPALTLKFEQLALRMHKNKAIIRIARKLLSRIRHLLINKEAYVNGKEI
ncbi:MAG: IS110 family transposase, partial [Bacteroidota bacterium]